MRSAPALGDYWALTKPDVNLLILITTFAGFYLGSGGHWRDISFPTLINTLIGTLLVASGTGTLNQYLERRFDAQMRRTARRPLAAGRLTAPAVLRFGILLSVAGGVYLAVAVNSLASLLAIVTLTSYLFLYTPLKRRTPLCTTIGAVPGAMPPLIGWAGATGTLTLGAWVLYALLFLWQFPHFMSIAWMYREDYQRAGYLVLPPEKRARAILVVFQTLWPLLALLPVSILPVALGEASVSFAVAAVLLTGCFFLCALRFVFRQSNLSARQLLTASIVYLPFLFVLRIAL